MPTTYTSFLGLALPATGELAGTWGTTVNSYISEYLDSAVAGVQTISGTQTAVTLSVANGASLVQAGAAGVTGSAQYMIINCTGTPASLLTISAPNASKVYVVINGTAQSVKLVGVTGPTSGVTMVTGEKAVCAWNGSDFVKVATSVADGVTSVAMTVPTLLSVSGSPITSSGTLALTYSGTALPVANGGTGLSSGTSGGVLAYTATGTLASSTALAASALVIGGGAGAAPSTTTTGTGVVTALGVNTGSAGAFVVNGGALGSPSSVGTMPAFTLGGTVSGGGNQINNVVIGTTTPLAGSFTTVSATGNLSTTGSSSVLQALAGASVQIQNTAASANWNLQTSGSGLSINSPQNGTLSLDNNTAVTGTLSATGASTLAALSATTGTFSTQAIVIGSDTSNALSPTALGVRVVNTNAGAAGRLTPIMFGGRGTANYPFAAIAGYVQTDVGSEQGGTLRFYVKSGTAASAPGIVGEWSDTGLALGVGISLTGGTSGTGYSFSGSAPATSLTLDASGQLGVGTASPSSILDVRGTTSSPVTFGLTTTGNPTTQGLKLTYDDAGNTFVYLDSKFDNAGAAISFRLRTAGTPVTAMTILGSGNVGIGTSSPGQTLHLKSETSANVQFEDTTSGTAGYVGPSANNQSDTTATRLGIRGEAGVAFSVGSATKMVLDSSGNLGIGTTSPVSPLTVERGNVTGAGQWASSAIAVYNPTNIGAYSQIAFGYTTSTTNAAAYIGFVSTNQTGSGFGDLVFGTRSVSTDTQPTERARIDSGGNLLVGTTSFATSASPSAGVAGGNFRSLKNTTTIPGLTTATVLTLSSSVSGVYIVQANFGPQSNEIYGGMLIVVANNGSFRIVTNGGGASSVLTLSGANVQMANAVGSTLDAYASAVLIAN